MRKYGIIILTASLVIYLTGCGKKKAEIEEFQEPLPPTGELAVTQPGTETAPPAATAPAAAPQITPPQAPPATQAQLEPLPPGGPYKPTVQEIQTALKNAGYYNGNVDGKAGPLTKKAIEQFQRENGLASDGKVGPKTWLVLGRYLSQEQPSIPVASRSTSVSKERR